MPFPAFGLTPGPRSTHRPDLGFDASKPGGLIDLHGLYPGKVMFQIWVNHGLEARPDQPLTIDFA